MSSQLANNFLDTLTRTKEECAPYPHDRTLRNMNPTDRNAYALLCIADAIRDAFYWLGSTDASTRVGALEMVELKNIAGSLDDVATAVENSGE